ncbi:MULTISPECIES: outer membrane beta-barrel protein [unclassified Candidatus Cardinium]|uniref:outer membrane beta-barrel protein n=1 Tax=unclassified Candidatus Cardinium TaxID=2641185 RepID=UPI001FB2F667|nr:MULTISPECIES: outer membrane beta-barrel protein [unclassified Candidatus Cardinium]
MTRIKKTLMAGVLVCTALNAQAEVSPFGFGAKLGGSVTPYAGSNCEAKINSKEIKCKYFDNLFVCGGLYGEYAFNDYVGGEIQIGYLRQGFTLEAQADNASDTKTSDTKTDDKKTAVPSITMLSHGLHVPISLCVYPLGRQQEQGILKIMLGGAPYMPLSTTCKKSGENFDLTDDHKKEVAGFSLAATAGVAYELPFGLFIDIKYGFNFMNSFDLASDKSQTIFSDATDLKQAKPHHLTVNAGYNLASLFL